MNPTDLYGEVASRFPALWPQMPEWNWVSVHDGRQAMPSAIRAVLNRYVSSSEVVVVVHSVPGVAVALPKERAVGYITEYVTLHEVQVSDPGFEHFVSFSKHGVATGDA